MSAAPLFRLATPGDLAAQVTSDLAKLDDRQRQRDFLVRMLVGVTALVAVAAVGALLVIDVPQFRRGEHEAILRWPWWVRGVTYAGLVLATLLLSGSPSPFIYFQF